MAATNGATVLVLFHFWSDLLVLKHEWGVVLALLNPNDPNKWLDISYFHHCSISFVTFSHPLSSFIANVDKSLPNKATRNFAFSIVSLLLPISYFNSKFDFTIYNMPSAICFRSYFNSKFVYYFYQMIIYSSNLLCVF